MSFALRSVRLVPTAIAASLFAVGTAHASGFALMEQNGSGLGNAYAGQAAAAEDASTIFFNPAGMTNVKGRQFVVGGTFIFSTGAFDDEGSTTAPAQFSLGGEGGDAGGLSAVPYAYLSWEVTPNFWAGVGFSVPFGLSTEYDEDWMGRFYGTHSEVMTQNINPSVAWKINESVSVGAGVSYQKISATLKSAVNYSGALAQALGPGALPALAGCPGAIPAGPAAGVGCEGLATVDGDDWSWGWNVGAMFNINPDTRLGLSYRSKVEHTLEGEVKYRNLPALLNGVGPLVNADIEADLDLPDTLSAALSHQISQQWQLLADYTWTGWDSVQTIKIKNKDSGEPVSDLDLKFRNSWRVGVGLNYQYNDAWKWRFGVAYDKSPVKDEFRTVRLPDEDRFWVSLGAQVRFAKEGVVELGYSFVTTTTAPEVDLSTQGNGDLKGDYDSYVHLFGAQLSYSF